MALLFALACGDGGSSRDPDASAGVDAAVDSGPGEYLALEDFASAYADRLCEMRVACKQAPDKQSCIDATFLDLVQIMAGVDTGTLQYDGYRANECLDILSGGQCMVLVNLDDSDNACTKMLIGTVADGDLCFLGEECAGEHSVCQPSGEEACAPGSCVLSTVPGDAGDPCSAEEECGDDLYCKNMSSCEPKLAEGQVCDSIYSCEFGSICNLTPGVMTPTCITLPRTGETCDPLLFGDYLTCHFSTDFCDPDDTTCKSKLDPGAECSVELENCVDYSLCQEGLCVAKPLVGEDCVVDGELKCLGNLQCVEGKCVAPQPSLPCSAS